MEEVQRHQINISNNSAEMKKKFEVLEQLSDRLKNLQLCKIEYDHFYALNKEIGYPTHCVVAENVDDKNDTAYYANLQIKRKILETLSAVVSLRDTLKNNFYKTSSNDDILGYLQEEFKELNNKHKKIFKKTLGAKENAPLREFTTYFRNELIHNNMHEIEFWLFGIDYELTTTYLLCGFNEFKSNSKNKLTKLLEVLYGKYLIDDEIIPLILGIGERWLFQEFFDAMTKRVEATPEAYQAYLEYTNRHNQMDTANLTDDEQQEYAKNNYIQFGFDLIKIPEFLTYYVRLNNAGINEESPVHIIENGNKILCTSSPNFIRFNLGEALEDIYLLHFNYYSQVHSLIYDYLSKDFEAYRLENYSYKHIDMFYLEYSYKLPKIPKI